MRRPRRRRRCARGRSTATRDKALQSRTENAALLRVGEVRLQILDRTGGIAFGRKAAYRLVKLIETGGHALAVILDYFLDL
jgi:hypothetical protein